MPNSASSSNLTLRPNWAERQQAGPEEQLLQQYTGARTRIMECYA